MRSCATWPSRRWFGATTLGATAPATYVLWLCSVLCFSERELDRALNLKYVPTNIHRADGFTKLIAGGGPFARFYCAPDNLGGSPAKE